MAIMKVYSEYIIHGDKTPLLKNFPLHKINCSEIEKQSPRRVL